MTRANDSGERFERTKTMNAVNKIKGLFSTGRGYPSLKKAIESGAGRQARALLKHLNECGISCWSDITRGRLYELRDHLERTVAPSSAKTYLAALRAVLNRWAEDVPMKCGNFGDAMRTRGDRPVRVYLTPEELARLESVETRTQGERLSQLLFLVCAWTGMRTGDAAACGPENIEGGILRYVATKTGAHIEVPCRPEVAGWLEEIRRLGGFPLSTPGYIKTLRRLCERAGIDAEVKVRKAGRDYTARKWECVSGHTARISFCTNLAVAGVPLCDIKTLAGHTSEAMTERYIAAHTPKLGSRAMEMLTGTDERPERPERAVVEANAL